MPPNHFVYANTCWLFELDFSWVFPFFLQCTALHCNNFNLFLFVFLFLHRKGFDAAKHWLAVSSILLIIGAASVAVPLALRVAASK